MVTGWQALINSLMALAAGAIEIACCVYALRSRTFIPRMLESVLTSRRRAAMPEVIAQGMLWGRVTFVFGLVMGSFIALLGLIALVISLIKVLGAS